MLCDFRRRGSLIKAMTKEVAALEKALQKAASPRVLQSLQRPLYLKTDTCLGVPAGGSVAHMAGVVNELSAFGLSPIVISTSVNLMLSKDIEVKRIQPAGDFWDFSDLPALHLNFEVSSALNEVDSPGWIYHRYGLNGIAGVLAARRYQVPLVIEYNGSEIWIRRHWGGGATPFLSGIDNSLARRIEFLNLRSADLIVTVSEPLKADLIRHGIAPEKVLVNPNGVDTSLYSPEIDGHRVRKSLGLEGKCVVGFIGTFGVWHGAEVLVEAFSRVLRVWDSTESLVLLMVGDGIRRESARQLAQKLGVTDQIRFVGMVPQAEGPSYLAACNVLVAPHMPNPDGSPFFGSPTKLFEYMAMGRAIVASNLEQIGIVLRHKETAWLVEPGDAESLGMGLLKVLRDPVFAKSLARNAREVAVRFHTWRAHTKRIIDALEARCT
jgi:glycosyltransferase involved in cell wall biosynthesis